MGGPLDSTTRRASRRRRSWPTVLGILLLSLVVAVTAALLATAGSAARTVVTLQPLAIGELFQAPGTERDRDVDARAAANEALSPEIDAATELAISGPVTLDAEVVDADAGTIEIIADTGDVTLSQQAANAAAQALLDQRQAQGVERADGGLLAVQENLATLEAQRDEMTDLGQIERQEQRLFDQRASLDQLNASRDQLLSAPPGAYSGALPLGTGGRFVQVEATVFLLVASTLLLLRWAVRRWRGPVTRRRGLLGTSVPGSSVARPEDLAAFARSIVLDGRRTSGPVVLVAAVAPADGPAAPTFARALADEIATRRPAALVDGTGELGEAADRSLVEVDGGGASQPEGRALLVDAARPGADPAALVATEATASALAELGAQVDVVVLLAPEVPGLAALAWSAHADEVVLVVEERTTWQRDVRAAVGALDRTAPDLPVRAALVPAERGTARRAGGRVPPPAGDPEPTADLVTR